MDKFRRFQRDEARRKLEEERRNRELKFHQQQEEFLRNSTKTVPLSKAASASKNEQNSQSNHSLRVPLQTQENSTPVARQTKEIFSSTDSPNSMQVDDSRSSKLQTSIASRFKSPASYKRGASQKLFEEESSGEESVDLVAYAKASQGQNPVAVKKSCNPSPLRRVTSTGSNLDNSTDSGSVQERKSPGSVQERKSPRNPFTLAMTSRTAKQLSQEITLKSTKDNLWGDSDNDEEISNETKAETIPPTRTRKKRTLIEKEEQERPIRQKEAHSAQSLDEFKEDDGANIDSTELKPNFEYPKFGPLDFEPFVLNAGDLGRESPICVPASISRYLPLYQKEGIQFLYDQAVRSGHGAILGDDMGLGKTVQIIGLLSALLKKKGDGSDLVDLIRRKNVARKNLTRFQNIRDDALEQGNVPAMESEEEALLRQNTRPDWAPILIIVPNSVIQNWITDFATWGHFSVVVYRGENRASALEQIEIGGAEILLMGKSLITSKDSFRAILEPKGNLRWKLIVVDEFHQFKNFSKAMSKNLRILRNAHTRNIIGLTGTLMQNYYSELWNLVDIVHENFLGSKKEFSNHFGKPIKLGMSRNSTPSARKHAKEKQLELSRKMPIIHKRRLKEQELKDLLPMKDERVVFCKPSTLQVKIYKHLLRLPDFEYLSKANIPCGCGVNKRFFVEIQRLTSREEQIAFQRANKNNIITRKDCCFPAPAPPDIRDAVIWRQNHENDELCVKCPFCICLPVLTILNKLSSHVSLLQVEMPKSQIDEHAEPKKWKEAEQLEEQAEVFLPDHLLDELPGKSRVQRNGLMNDHCKLSGKMAVLKRLLSAIDSQQGRVLLFSSSTKMLNLIEDFIKSEGYSYLRMDGSTDTTRRTEIVDIFKRDTNSFVFLLSTKAMGLGLNLTEAAFVIIFDVEWNPSWDSQAQDRAYRIGQQKNVQVFRLVTKGTIEEIKYLRQVYKTHLTHATIPDNQSEIASTRLFEGVAKDKYRRGELFGIANLLKFSEDTFMNYATKSESKETNKYYGQLGNDIHSVEALQTSLKNLSEEEKEAVFLDEEDVFPNLATRKDDSSDPEGSDDEVILGGESQLILAACDDMEDIDDTSNPDEDVSDMRTRERSPNQVNVAERIVLNHSESPPSNIRQGVTYTKSPPSNNEKGVIHTESTLTHTELTSPNSRKRVKRKLEASSTGMKAADNFSLVGIPVRQIDSHGTSFGMSDFAVPNSRGKSKKR